MTTFNVEATIEIPLTAKIKPKDEAAVSRWLRKQFHHHDDDFTVAWRNRTVTARVQNTVDIDLSKVTGKSLVAQLRSLHKIAKSAFASSFSIPSKSVYQLDVLISG